MKNEIDVRVITDTRQVESATLERRTRAAVDKPNQSPEWETKIAISAILDISMRPIGFQQQLKEILGVLMSISWLKVGNKGGVFVANRHNELVLKVQHNLHNEIRTMCAKVAFGRCLCGMAAQSKKIMYKTCIDHQHENRFEGMSDHGHYNIPLLDQDANVLGVIVIYLEAHHQQHPEEMGLMEMIGHTVSNFIANRNLHYKAEIAQVFLQKAQIDIIHKLVAAAEYRDSETGEHIKRMSLYAGAIAKTLGMNNADIDCLVQAAPLHDIGKVGISDSILLKPGKLDAREFAVMRNHAKIGSEILTGDHPLIEAGREIAGSHHEKWDGTGYPYGLAGDDIPLFARICALADVFDALMTKRPYKEPWPLEETLAYIKSQSGSHFSPAIVNAFFDSMGEILRIQSLHSEHKTRPMICALEEKPTANSLVQWDDKYSIDSDLLDQQHRYFFNLINRVDEAINNSAVLDIIEAMLALREYADIHFFEEEQSMFDNNYPGLSKHQDFHAAYILKMDGFLQDLKITPLAVTAELTHYLSSWLSHHVQKADYEYSLFYSETS
jgi:hemerythrin-like metal-binding protein